MKSLKRNLPLLCMFKACQMSLFPLSIITLFHQFQIGLTQEEILLVQGVKSFICALAEFPAGWLADRIGYRKTLILGTISVLVCWVLYTGVNTFTGVLIADAFLGIGWSFIYGTDAAVLYESLLGQDRLDELSMWNGRTSFWGQLTEAGCAVSAGFLYEYSPTLPFYIQVVISVVNIGLATMLMEPNRPKSVRKDKIKEIFEMFKKTYIGSPILRYSTILFIVLGIASYLQVWNIQVYAEKSGIPTSWLGLNWAAANIFVALGSLYSHKIEKRLGIVKTLYLCIFFISLGYTGLTFLPGMIGFLCYYFLTFERGINYPVLNDIQQKVIDSENRAGMLSITNFSFRLIFAIICPVAGWLIENRGFNFFFGVAGVFFVTFGLVLLRRLKIHLVN